MRPRETDIRPRVLLEHVWQHLTREHRIELAKRALYDMPAIVFDPYLELRLSFMDLAAFVADQAWPKLDTSLHYYLRDATERLADPVAMRPTDRARV